MKKHEGIEKIRQIFNKVVPIPEAEWEYLASRMSVRTFEKGEYLARAGEVVEYYFFVVRGLIRFFYSTEDGKEFNKHFVMENGFAGSFHSQVLKEPCGFFIQALESTETIMLPNPAMVNAFDRHPCWERIGRVNAERLVLIKEAREKELLLDPLEVRYLRFLKDFPGLAERLPQYHIASYLGVTDVALSRIRKQLSQNALQV